MDIRLAVTVPSHGNIHPTTTVSLEGMCRYWYTEVVPSEVRKDRKMDFKMMLLHGHLPDSRHACVREAFKWDATHMLFVDSDMSIPSDAPIRLLNGMIGLQAGLHKDVPEKEEASRCAVLGCNYARRTWPTRPTAAYLDRAPVYTDHERVMEGETAEFEVVRHLGAGCMLIDMRVFHLLELPFFMFDPKTDHLGFQGEDVYFCVKVREKAGCTVWVDHMTSLGVKHIGDFEYTNQMAVECKQLVDKEDKLEESAA